jgi:hypothetical protein
MKRIFVVCIAFLALSGALSAQAAPAAPQSPAAQAAQSIVKLSGKLEVINGMIGLKADGTSYLIPNLSRLVGFVKELQEGAAVKVEGYSYPIPAQAGFAMLHATKLTIGTKDYDLGQAGGFGPFGGKGMQGGRGGWGGDRGRGGMMGGGMMGRGQGFGPRR